MSLVSLSVLVSLFVTHPDLSDPGFAPASGFREMSRRLAHTNPCIVAGTVEIGGWTTREVKRILRGLAGLNFV